MTRKEVEVTTKDRPEASFEFNFSENIAEAIELFEEKTVHDYFIRALTIAAQANARKMLAAGYTAERIQNEMDAWKPGATVSMRGSIKTVDPVKVITENFDDWTEERQQEIFDLIAARFASRGQKPELGESAAAPDQNDPRRQR